MIYKTICCIDINGTAQYIGCQENIPEKFRVSSFEPQGAPYAA
jgi:hypothetical protein